MKRLSIIMAIMLLTTSVLPVFAVESELPAQTKAEILQSDSDDIIVEEQVIAEGDEVTSETEEIVIDDEVVKPSEPVEDVTDNEVVTTPTNDENNNDKINSIVDGMGKGTKVSMHIESRKFNSIVKYEYESDLTDKQKQGMMNFLTGLSKLYNSGEKGGSRSGEKYDYYAFIEIKIPNNDTYSIALYDNTMYMFGNGAYEIEAPEAVIDYIYNALDEELSFMGYKQTTPELEWRCILNYENQTYKGYSVRFDKYYDDKPMYYEEKLTFDVKLDDTYYDTEIGEIADSGEVVHCTIEQYFRGYIIYVLTIEGSHGTKQFFTFDYSSSFTPSTSGNKLFFCTNYIVDDGVCSSYSSTKIHEISFVGSTSGGSISGITMSYATNSSIILRQPSDLEVYNIEYEFYGTDKDFNMDRNLVARFGLPLTPPTRVDDSEKESQDTKQEADKTVDEKTEALDFAGNTADNAQYADTLNELGLFKGTESGYELDKPLTREESATMIVRLRGKESEALAGDYNEVFADSPKDKWSFPYVMYCYENEITKGTGSDTFTPESNISAEEFITFILRLLGYTDAAPENAYDIALEVNLLDAEFVRKLQSSDTFLREDMVYIAYNSLKTKNTSGELLADTLLSDGVISQEQADELDVNKNITSMDELLDGLTN